MVIIPSVAINPNAPMNLGQVAKSLAYDFVLILAPPTGFATPLQNLKITNIVSSSGDIVNTDSLPLTYDNYTVIHFTLTPSATGPQSVTITITSDATEPTYTYTVIYTVLDPAVVGIPQLSMANPDLPVGVLDNTQLNNTTTEDLVITNTGDSNITVNINVINGYIGNITTLDSDFSLSPPVLNSVTLTPTETLSIPISVTPTVLGVDTSVLQIGITNIIESTQITVPLSVISFPFTPVSIVDNADQLIVIAFANGSIYALNINDFNFNEGDSTAIFNGPLWNRIGMENTIERLEVFYENVGVCDSLTATLTVLRPSIGPDELDIVSDTISIGTAEADGSDRSQYFDLTASGEILLLTLTHGNNSGPCSITAIVPHFSDRGEKVENV